MGQHAQELWKQPKSSASSAAPLARAHLHQGYCVASSRQHHQALQAVLQHAQLGGQRLAHMCVFAGACECVRPC